MFFFFKQKTAYEIYQCDWSSDVCSSDLTLNIEHPLLSDNVLDGIGGAGVSFNLNRWREFVYFIKLVTAFKKLSSNEQNALMDDSWQCAEWIEAIPDGENRQLRNMLVFLLFPDYFERIFGGRDRVAIVSHYKSLTAREVRIMSQLDIDRTLLQIRQEFEDKRGTKEFDFYLPDIITEWRTQDQEAPNAQNINAGIPPNITRENVLQALEEIDSEGVLASAQSTTYDLLHDKNFYPPKYVLSLANKYANGEILDRNSFEGGEETPAFSVLRDLGFVIERKDFQGYFLKRFITQADAETDLTTRHYIRNYRNLSVRVSFGQGNFAKIPWVSLLAHDQTTSHGIYPVFLYYKKLGVLVLAKGISETQIPDIEWTNIDSCESVNDYLVRKYNTTPDRYGDSYVYKVYKVNNGVIEGNSATELDKLIDEYNKKIQEIKDKGKNYVFVDFGSGQMDLLEEKIKEFKNKIKVCNLDGIKLLKRLEQQKKKSKYFIFLDPPYFQKGQFLYLNHYNNRNHEELSKDRKSTRLNSSHTDISRMPSSA